MKEYYLKPTVQSEPLIWRWYAWSNLISPLTAGCNITERYLKIMQSYVSNPQIHAQAIKDPKMLGGPFIDYEEEKVADIQQLIEKTKEDCSELIAITYSFKEFDRILQGEARGQSVEYLYSKIPKILKGMIEIVYDLNNHPSLRIIEPIFYKYYYSDIHQEIVLSHVNNDFRKFCLSTPRLDEKNELYLKIPFADKRLDQLFSAKQQPCDLNFLKELLQTPKIKENLFESFFTTAAPRRCHDNNYKKEGVRIRYFGHACVLVQTRNISILFDPVISYSVESEVSRYTFEDLPDQIDYVIITHNHQDHVMFETLLQLRHKILNVVLPTNNKGFLADPSLKLVLKNIGFNSLIELSEFQSVSLQEGKITALPFFGEHSDINIHTKLSYCVELQEKKFVFAADSNNLDELLYDHIYQFIGEVDIIFIGMECDGAPLSWIYGPLLTNPINRSFDQSRTLSGSDSKKALTIVDKLKCKQAYVYAMGQEPWLNYVMALNYNPESLQILESNKFVAACRSKNITSERLFGKKEWVV